MKLIIIIGMGHGISMGVARFFGKKGFSVGMVARSETELKQLQVQLQRENINAYYQCADAANYEALSRAIQELSHQYGPLEVLHYNVARIRKSSVLELKPEDLLQDQRVNIGAALQAAQTAIPIMEAEGKGQLLFTGGGLGLHPSPVFASLSVGKAGLRNLVEALHKALKDSPIKVNTLTVAGFVSADSPKHNPDNLARVFWEMYQHDSDKWERIV